MTNAQSQQNIIKHDSFGAMRRNRGAMRIPRSKHSCLRAFNWLAPKHNAWIIRHLSTTADDYLPSIVFDSWSSSHRFGYIRGKLIITLLHHGNYVSGVASQPWYQIILPPLHVPNRVFTRRLLGEFNEMPFSSKLSYWWLRYPFWNCP